MHLADAFAQKRITQIMFRPQEGFIYPCFIGNSDSSVCTLKEAVILYKCISNLTDDVCIMVSVCTFVFFMYCSVKSAKFCIQKTSFKYNIHLGKLT